MDSILNTGCNFVAIQVWERYRDLGNFASIPAWPHSQLMYTMCVRGDAFWPELFKLLLIIGIYLSIGFISWVLLRYALFCLWLAQRRVSINIARLSHGISGVVVWFLNPWRHKFINAKVTRDVNSYYDERFVQECSMPGSPMTTAKPPAYLFGIWVLTDTDEKTFVGSGWRHQGMIFTAKHVLEAVRNKWAYLTVPNSPDVLVDFHSISWKASDRDMDVAYAPYTQKLVGLKSAPMTHVPRGKVEIATCYSAHPSRNMSIGRLANDTEIFGHLAFNGSTRGGFSGGVYVVKGKVVGMHLMAFGDHNSGLSAGFFVKAHLRPEDSEDIVLERVLKRANGDLSNVNWERNLDEVVYEDEGRYYYVDQDEWESAIEQHEMIEEYKRELQSRYDEKYGNDDDEDNHRSRRSRRHRHDQELENAPVVDAKLLPPLKGYEHVDQSEKTAEPEVFVASLPELNTRPENFMRPQAKSGAAIGPVVEEIKGTPCQQSPMNLDPSGQLSKLQTTCDGLQAQLLQLTKASDNIQASVTKLRQALMTAGVFKSDHFGTEMVVVSKSNLRKIFKKNVEDCMKHVTAPICQLESAISTPTPYVCPPQIMTQMEEDLIMLSTPSTETAQQASEPLPITKTLEPPSAGILQPKSLPTQPTSSCSGSQSKSASTTFSEDIKSMQAELMKQLETQLKVSQRMESVTTAKFKALEKQLTSFGMKKATPSGTV